MTKHNWTTVAIPRKVNAELEKNLALWNENNQANNIRIGNTSKYLRFLLTVELEMSNEDLNDIISVDFSSKNPLAKKAEIKEGNATTTSQIKEQLKNFRKMNNNE
jgi:hypothetical protein|tara:strand:- start:29 stop:343 length:315 start_codon:yes stop_codon:yes gene_type:complete